MASTAAKTLFDFVVTGAKGEAVALSQFKGKVVLVVNVASKCGFTPQYKGLQELQDKLGPKGFTVLGFPCNQFLGQEPGTMEEICTFACQRFNATFPIMSKVDVNGAGEAPIYNFLKTSVPGFLGSTAVKWNFTKFLCDREGRPVQRYSSTTSPDAILPDIEKLLG
eukprot:RCo036298